MKSYPNWLDFELACGYPFHDVNRIVGRRSLWHGAASPHYALSCLLMSARPWSTGNGRPRWPPAWCAGAALSSSWPTGTPTPRWRDWSACNGRWSASGPSAFWPSAWRASPTPLAAGPRAVFPPEVAIHVVRLACERPDHAGSQPLAVGLHRTGAPAHRGGDRGGHLRRHGAADSGRASTETLAPACLALSQAAAGRRVLCHGLRADRALHPSAACG